jgi:hypothetical protein
MIRESEDAYIRGNTPPTLVTTNANVYAMASRAKRRGGSEVVLVRWWVWE